MSLKLLAACLSVEKKVCFLLVICCDVLFCVTVLNKIITCFHILSSFFHFTFVSFVLFCGSCFVLHHLHVATFFLEACTVRLGTSHAVSNMHFISRNKYNSTRRNLEYFNKKTQTSRKKRTKINTH